MEILTSLIGFIAATLTTIATIFRRALRRRLALLPAKHLPQLLVEIAPELIQIWWLLIIVIAAVLHRLQPARQTAPQRQGERGSHMQKWFQN